MHFAVNQVISILGYELKKMEEYRVSKNIDLKYCTFVYFANFLLSLL